MMPFLLPNLEHQSTEGKTGPSQNQTFFIHSEGPLLLQLRRGSHLMIYWLV